MPARRQIKPILTGSNSMSTNWTQISVHSISLFCLLSEDRYEILERVVVEGELILALFVTDWHTLIAANRIPNTLTCGFLIFVHGLALTSKCLVL